MKGKYKKVEMNIKWKESKLKGQSKEMKDMKGKLKDTERIVVRAAKRKKR